jgi:hypothetical protein
MALLSGFLAAFYLPFAWNSSVVLGETLAATLTALLLLLALLIADPKSRRGMPLMLSFGVVCAALAMVRPVMILWVPAPLVYVAVRRMEPPRRLLRLAAIVLAGVLLVMAPWWVRNAITLHKFVPLAENGGANLLLSVGGPPLTPTEQAINDAAEARGKDSDTAVAMYRIRAALRQDPIGFLAARADMVRHSVWSAWSQQIGTYWGLRYTPEVVQIQVGRYSSHPSSALYYSWFLADYYHELLLILAACALLQMKRHPRLLIVASIPLYTIVVYSLTLFINRYFFPAMPAVILLAGVSLSWIVCRVPGLSLVGQRERDVVCET